MALTISTKSVAKFSKNGMQMLVAKVSDFQVVQAGVFDKIQVVQAAGREEPSSYFGISCKSHHSMPVSWVFGLVDK
jgi:hypothetical protein